MKGSAIVTALILIVIGTFIIGGYLLFVSRENQMAKRINGSIKALYIAEAGLEQKLYEIKNGDYDDIPMTYFPDPGDGNTYYTVDVAESGSKYIVTSTGCYYGEERKIRTYVKVVSIWDTAIFAGGSSVGMISGNTHIRGTVYTLGEESFIDTNKDNIYDAGIDILVDENENGARDHLTSEEIAIDGTGTFYIGNNYDQFGGSNRIPNEFSPDRFPFIDTLDAELNVKYGMVNLGGNAHIGNEDVPMSGANVPDGFNSTENVFVEEGGLIYDRGMFNEKIRFPNLADAYEEYSTEEGGRLAYLREKAEENESLISGSLEITPNSNFEYGNLDNYIKMEDGILSVAGVVYIDGDITFSKYRHDDTIYYTGKGSIVSTGDITIDINLYTQETGENAYPGNNIIGFMTPNNIYLGSVSQIELMAIFYAGGTIDSEKQTSVAGTFIAQHVDIGNQVPEIFQVKNMRNNLPPDMIDLPPVIVSYGWHEIFD